MLNAEKIKKRFYISLVFYVLFGIALLLVLDSAVSPNFTQEYKLYYQWLNLFILFCLPGYL